MAVLLKVLLRLTKFWDDVGIVFAREADVKVCAASLDDRRRKDDIRGPLGK